MEILKAILFGIVEGVTEWLPVSSTGHMILLDEFIKLNVSDEFYELFSVVIQLAAIIAVIVFYFKDIFPWGPNKSKEDTKKIFNLWGKVLVACVPAGVIGILFDDLLDKYLYNGIVVALTLIIYGVIFIVMENKGFGDKHTKSMDDITYKQAFEVGAFQVLALIPGTSRSGATIIGGLISGLDRKPIANFTFILAIPVMFGASLVKLLKYIKNVGLAFTSSELSILIVGSIVAFVVSLFIIKFLIGYVRKHDFKVFGYYRIVLGIIVLLYFAVKLLA
ncbi:MAG TPA: undecaprenyl-diphosphate phosphatase [Bacilli bacterium]|nr:undecaprenyl-diphosphate phosphatase [Bacilli bacterium]